MKIWIHWYDKRKMAILHVKGNNMKQDVCSTIDRREL